MKPYLVGLDLTGRRVVVVGAGTVAQRRLPRLIAAGADVLLVAPEATPAVEAMAGAGELRWEVRDYAEGDLEAAWYALACTSSPAVNAAVAAEAQRQRVFCVRADDATGGSAVTAAAAEHDGLLLGVLAGRRPRRSAAVRDALLEALRTGVVDDAPDAEDHVTTPGVALVGAGPGHPDLITVRGRRLLARADVVLADRLAPRELLDELGAHVTVIDAAKVPYGRAMAQEQINAQLIEHAHPLALDRLAARFPDLTILAAHPGWPWIDEMTAVALHKGNVYWEMSGWAPKYFPPQLRTDIRGRLRDKVMFGSDHPSMPYERILREWDELGLPDEAVHAVFHGNAERVLGL